MRTIFRCDMRRSGAWVGTLTQNSQTRAALTSLFLLIGASANAMTPALAGTPSSPLPSAPGAPTSISVQAPGLTSPRFAATTQAATPAAQTPAVQKRIWNLHGVSLRNVIDQVARVTGKTFIVDPNVKGKVDLISTRPMSPTELYQTFLTVLQVQGFAAVPLSTGNQHSFKVVPKREATHAGLPLRSTFYPGRGAEMVTRVFTLKNVSALDLVSVLRPMLAEHEGLRAVPNSNMLVLSGPAESLLRIGRILKRVDVATDTGIEMLPLRYASAAEMVNVLKPLLNNNRFYKRVAPITLAADDRSNSLLMTGSKTSRLRVRVLVSQLDTPKSFGGDTQVVYLHYLQAKDFAPVLRKVSKTAATAEGQSKSALRVAIEAEPKTNALVISAPQHLMRALKSVIARLDIRPAQVSVEAVIVEVDDATLKKLGVQWGTVSSDGSFISGNDTGFGSGVGLIHISGSLKHPHFTANNLSAVVSALKGDSHTNILSTPSLVVLDNQKARIEVGNTVSIETGSYATTGNTQTATPYTTFDRQKIGLHLEVTPQISQGNAVRLTIDQGNETLRDPEEPGSRPVTNNSSITTQVLVNSGDILVLGGLISNDLEQSHSKIPLLGSIPVAGKLFHYKRSRVERKNLMVFLRPSIMRTNVDNRVITQGKYQFMRQRELQAQPGTHRSSRRHASHTLNHAPRVLPQWQKTPSQLQRKRQVRKPSRRHHHANATLPQPHTALAELPVPFANDSHTLSTTRQRSWHSS